MCASYLVFGAAANQKRASEMYDRINDNMPKVQERQKTWMDPATASEELALHLKNNIGIEVRPGLLRTYLLAHWDEVSRLAHEIHRSKT